MVFYDCAEILALQASGAFDIRLQVIFADMLQVDGVPARLVPVGFSQFGYDNSKHMLKLSETASC